MTTTVGAPERQTDPPAPSPRASSQVRRPRTQLFAGMWRWHFYASFLVVPVLALRAATGLIYLFRFQLEPALHPDLMQVEPRPGVNAATYDDQREVVEQALDADNLTGAYIVSMTEPRDAESPTRFLLEVRPDDRPALESLLAGLPLGRLGEVMAATRLTILGLSGRPVVDADLDGLKSAWQSPLRW